MLCQLSYSRALGRATITQSPSFDQSHRSDLNRRPLDYESSALPLSYGGGTSGAEGNRTPDLCSAIAALSHLSYSPENQREWAVQDSNL